MPKTRLISPGSIPNHKLLKNLQLQDNYISNDGGDEGITVDDAGDVGINIPTTITPSAKFEVFNSNVQHSDGTASQSSQAITGSGTTFTIAMEGGRFVFDDGTDAGIIVLFITSAILVVSSSQTVSSGNYKIYYPSVQIDTGASSTTLKIGDMSISKDEIDIGVVGNFTIDAGGDIALSADGGNITMNDGTTTVFDFDIDTPALKIMDDADTGDYCSIAVGANGATNITTVDNAGQDADLTITVDGRISLVTSTWSTDNYIGLSGYATYITPITKTASGTHDVSLYIAETLNLSIGAGGSDVHYGIWYGQSQLNLAGWDSVYLMYLTGGDAARTFAIQADGKVGIGVADPASPLEIFNTASQLKISYDASYYTDISVADDGELEIATTGSTSSDITLDSAGAINIEPSRYLYMRRSGTTNGLIEIDLLNDPLITILSDADYNDTFKLQVNAAGATTMSTVDSDGEAAHLTIVPDGDCIIDRNTALTATGTAKGLHIDYDHTGISASGQTVTGIGLDLDMNCESITHVGTVNQTAIDIDMLAATAGTQSNTGIDIVCGTSDVGIGIKLDVSGGTKSTGIYLDNKNGGEDFKNVSSVDSTDYFVINTIAAGATTLTTVDTTVGATAHLTLDVDGDITLDAGGGDVNILQADLTMPDDKKVIFGDAGEYIVGDGTDLSITSSRHIAMIAGGSFYLDSTNGTYFFRDNADADDHFKITTVSGTGATTLETVSAAADGDLTIVTDGELKFIPVTKVISNKPLVILEGAAAVADSAGYGQIWVKDETPNELYFTTDAGDDIQLTDGTSAAGGGGSSVLTQVEVTISEAEMNALHTTEKELVAAQGANMIIIPVQIIAFIDRDSSTAQTANANLYIGVSGGTTLASDVWMFVKRFMYNESGDRVWNLGGLGIGEVGASAGGDFENRNLTVKLNAAITSGSIDSVKCLVTYSVYDNS